MCMIMCIWRCIMRTNIDIDDELLKEAFKYSNVKTKKELIALGLKEFIENHRRKDLREIKGAIRFRDGYDYKSMRK
jgi:Arc/MetJ family transcription regulator